MRSFDPADAVDAMVLPEERQILASTFRPWARVLGFLLAFWLVVTVLHKLGMVS